MSLSPTADSAVFYHIYPLGLLGAPERNDRSASPTSRLPKLVSWIPHLRELGVNAVLLGPVWESSTHGYDTIDHTTVDRRLGTKADLRSIIGAFHAAGFRVVLDAVYNHVGREHPAFVDVRTNGRTSRYVDWFDGIDFDRPGPFGDGFSYAGWNGTHDLVRLNTDHPDVRAMLFGATRRWFEDLDIDGLRLDTADVLDRGFQRDLATDVRSYAPDAWLMGEVIHGDYREWAGLDRLDSTTNYTLWKGLYSSFNDGNMFEVAWTLNQQSGPEGDLRDLALYTFADNHDVARIATTLHDERNLYPLHLLLFTAPGIPSIYYGSEWGITGEKTPGSDASLRPMMTIPPDPAFVRHPDLAPLIGRLSRVRLDHPALRHGNYRQVHVASHQLVFARTAAEEHAIVAVNGAAEPVTMTVSTDLTDGIVFHDALDPGYSVVVAEGQIVMVNVPSFWGRVLVTAPAG